MKEELFQQEHSIEWNVEGGGGGEVSLYTRYMYLNFGKTEKWGLINKYHLLINCSWLSTVAERWRQVTPADYKQVWKLSGPSCSSLTACIKEELRFPE